MAAMLGGDCPRSERGGYGGVKVPASLPPDQLLRIESLGDNCEPGFVLRKLGCEAGSLFRWARVTPDQLLAVLRADFDGIYEFAGLTPLYHDMVKDKRYGIGWHTEMRSAVAADGRWRFIGDETARQKIYRQEIEKIRYLTSKFISHAQLGGIIFVLKCNAGIATDVLYAILASLARIAAGNRFALLEIRASDDPAQVGTVTQERPDLLRGYISRFAPYEHADDIDMAAWTKIFSQAFQLFPCPDWQARLARRAGTESKIELPFPLDKSLDLTRPVLGDLRGGAAILLNGNMWCRPVNGAFRLHGGEPDTPGTILRWIGVHAPAASQLRTALKCPVDDSQRVDVAATVRDENGKNLAEWRGAVTPQEPQDFTLDFTPLPQRTVSIELTVHASRRLHGDERAVIDVAPLALYPAATGST
jgi:hypothetical protein